MSEETKNTAQEEETTDTPVTEETVENEPEVVENGEAETEEIPVEDGDEEASQDDKKDSKSKTSFFGKKKKEKDKFEQQIEELTDRLKRNMAEFDNFRKRTEKEKAAGAGAPGGTGETAAETGGFWRFSGADLRDRAVSLAAEPAGGRGLARLRGGKLFERG